MKTSDLIDELENRLNFESDKPEILKFCRESLGIDKVKLQLIENNIDKFTLYELEIFFKSK